MTPLELYKKPDSGSVTFSMRIPNFVNERLEEVSCELNMSKNKLINLMIEYGLKNMIIKSHMFSKPHKEDNHKEK